MRNLLIALTLTAACGVDQPADGLQLDIDTQDRVAGDFVRDDVGLTFDFRRDLTRAQHYAVLETEAGQHLMTEAWAGGWRLVNVLDGRLTISGPVDGEQRTTGDRAALSELLEIPEMKLLAPLRTALTEHGVDADLQTIAPAEVRAYLWMPGMMRP